MITVKKARLTKDSTIVDKIMFVEKLEDGSLREVEGAKCDWIAHDDVRVAFELLNPHVGFLCYLLEASGKTLDQVHTFTTITVQSFTISGDEEEGEEGFTISAIHVLPNGKSMPINTPFMKFSEEYEYMDELGSALHACQEEVLKYYEGKAAPKRQMDMFEQNLGEEDLSLHEEGVKVAKGAKAKKSKKMEEVEKE